jgi:hypothetical protein
MLSEAYVEHQIEKRVRIRIPSRRGDASYFEDLGNKLFQLAKFERIRTNPLTGSVLITHHEIDLQGIGDYAEKNSLFSLNSEGSAATPLARKVVNPIENFSHFLNQVTDGEVDLAGLIFVSLLGFGIFEIFRGRFTAPPWYTAFWYAFGIFTKSVMDQAKSGSSEKSA